MKHTRISLVKDVEELLEEHPDMSASEEVDSELSELYYDDLVVVNMDFDDQLVESIDLVTDDFIEDQL